MNTKEKLKIIIQEWVENPLPHFYARKFDMQYLDGNEILSIIGARRAGKTYLCYQIIQELQKNVPVSNILYVNFEDERLHPLNGDELTLLLDVYQEIIDVDMSKRIYVFIDEIQNVVNWSKWARRINERYKNLKLVITGSSSKLLSREIATELRGRTIAFTVFPLSFSEYLHAKNISFNLKNILYSKERITLKKQFNDYIQLGGFPALLDTQKPQDLLKEYFNVMFYRDIVERHNVSNIKLMEDFLSLLIDQAACKFSVSKTAKKLEEFGYSFSKNTLTNFLNYAEEAYLVFPIKKYGFKIREQMRAPKKLYVIDHGLLQTVRFAFSSDLGRILENVVYLALKRQCDNIYYYQNAKECDFITTTSAGKITEAIQVSKDISNTQTKQREIEGLKDALSQLNLKQGLILTEDEYEVLEENGYTIEILPIWYWLLRQN